jgi:hypothetical protein
MISAAVHESEAGTKRHCPSRSILQAAYSQRNAYVHAKWDENGAEPQKPWQFSIRTKSGKLSIVEKLTPIEDLEKAAAQIWSAGESFAKELRRYGMLQA